jgi:hypothetical protein
MFQAGILMIQGVEKCFTGVSALFQHGWEMFRQRKQLFRPVSPTLDVIDPRGPAVVRLSQCLCDQAAEQAVMAVGAGHA